MGNHEDEAIQQLYTARRHHPLCPYEPGGELAAGEVCMDCAYGAQAEKREGILLINAKGGES